MFMDTSGRRDRSDLWAAVRGGDTEQGMEGERDPKTASLEQARYWSQVYAEILAMEEQVMERIRELMTHQSAEVRRDAELTNVPVIAAQVERFRRRLSYWTVRVAELEPPPQPMGC